MKSMDKDTDSIGTVQMKADYAQSEVYSTASEAPPAYMKRRSNSVKIAKIAAVTIIAASFIIGSFILAATYLQARASCSQMELLDNIMEKELSFEQKQQQNIPKPELLVGNQTPILKESESRDESKSTSENDIDNDDDNESDNRHHVIIKMANQMNPAELVNAFMAHSDRSRMNCVVERKTTEEEINDPGRNINLAMGLHVITRPKKGTITGERMVINCDNGKQDEDEDTEREAQPVVRPILIPIRRFQQIPQSDMQHHIPITFGDLPRGPLTHMPQHQMPNPYMMHSPVMHFQNFNSLVPEPSQHEMPPPPPPPQQQLHQEQMHQQQLHQEQMHQQQLHQQQVHENMSNQNQLGARDQNSNDDQPKIHIQIRRIPLSEFMNNQNQAPQMEDNILRNILQNFAIGPHSVERPIQQSVTSEDNSYDDSDDAEEAIPKIFDMIRGMMDLPLEQSFNDDSSSESNMSETKSDQTSNENNEAKPKAKSGSEIKPNEDKKDNDDDDDNDEDDDVNVHMRVFPYPIIPSQNSRILFGRSLINPVHIPVPMDQEQADQKTTILNPTEDKPAPLSL